MNGKPFASFCFSTYNRPDYLRDTLKSILSQGFTDYEVIVSDNDTNETGRTVVESFKDPRFKYFPNGENLGMKRSFNMSLSRSSGAYIVMIADDDPVYPFMLESLHALSLEFPGYGMYMGGCDWFCTSKDVGKLYGFKVGTNTCLSSEHDLNFKKAYSPADFLKSIFTFGIFPHYLWSTAIVRREILEAAGGVPEYGTPFLGDYAYMSTIGAVGGCVILNRSLGCQTLHNENFGRKQNEQLPVAARNFPAYIESKASHLPEWPVIQPLVMRFTAMWLVSHMSFLHTYNKKTKGDMQSLREAAQSVFAIDYMRKYKLKYFLKTRMPLIHHWIVRLKKNLK